MFRGAARLTLTLAVGLALGFAPPAFDLDVAVPPGSPLEWTASFPGYTPPNLPLFPETGAAAEGDPARSSAKSASSDADVRFANSFGQVRILTWDLGAHLPWTMKPVPVPTTGRSTLRPPPPQYGDPLYWIALAPLLRLLLHPDSLVRSEVLAHLVELGEPVLPVLGAAAGERELTAACRELRALIPVDLGATPTPPAGATPREACLARIALEECLRDQPFDPSDDFGRRLYLFAAEAEPLLVGYAEHPSLELARGAVAALGRYETRTAVQFLATLAGRVEDPVTLVRALAALGRYRGPLDAAPLVARLVRTQEPVQRAALIGALGRLGVREASPLLLDLGERARRERDPDLLISILSAQARIASTKAQPELAAFAERVADEAKELGQRSENATKPDIPDAPSLRATILAQLALFVRSQALPLDEKVRAEILALAQPAPLDARLSELGVGGTDPLGTLPAAARFLYLEALLRAGPEGLERLAGLVRRSELETALRGRALALLPYDQRGTLAIALVNDPAIPVELRIQALEVLIRDVHPKAQEVAKKQLGREELAAVRPPAGVLFLAQRAVRYLSELGQLSVRELLPLQSFVRHPLSERAALVAELRERLAAFVAAARDGERVPELKEMAGALVDFVLEHKLNALLTADMRAERVSSLMQGLDPARATRAPPEVAGELVPRLLLQLLGGESDWFRDPGRALFQPLVPLGEEVLLALGRTHDPLAVELILPALSGAHELRAHACLALGMCGQASVAERLLPQLLDEDPFVRFAASESLRHLLKKEQTLDWMTAPPAERARAAEELKQWLLQEGR